MSQTMSDPVTVMSAVTSACTAIGAIFVWLQGRRTSDDTNAIRKQVTNGGSNLADQVGKIVERQEMVMSHLLSQDQDSAAIRRDVGDVKSDIAAVKVDVAAVKARVETVASVTDANAAALTTINCPNGTRPKVQT